MKKNKTILGRFKIFLRLIARIKKNYFNCRKYICIVFCKPKYKASEIKA